MELNKVKENLKVKITKLTINRRSVPNGEFRKSGVHGVTIGVVPGFGGDIWWVEHDNGDIGAYDTDEFEEL